MECEPKRINASSFADNVSRSIFSVAINLSSKLRWLQARLFSNASRYSYPFQLLCLIN